MRWGRRTAPAGRSGKSAWGSAGSGVKLLGMALSRAGLASPAEPTTTEKEARMVDRCTARQPLMMVIPPQGVTISCPIHKGGHFIRGSSIRLRA